MDANQMLSSFHTQQGTPARPHHVDRLLPGLRVTACLPAGNFVPLLNEQAICMSVAGR